MKKEVVYLQLDWKSSTMYQYCKDEEEGTEPHTNTKGVISYRRYFKKGVTGVLLNADVADSKIGPEVVMTLKDADTYYKLKFGLKGKDGLLNGDFVESIIIRLGNLQKGVEYTFYPYELLAEDARAFDVEKGNEVKEKYYNRRAVSIKENGQPVKMSLTFKEGEENSIPRLVWKADPLSGKNKPTAASKEIRSDFLASYLMEAVNGHLTYEGNSSGHSTNTNPPPATTAQQPKMAPNTDYDDLPF